MSRRRQYTETRGFRGVPTKPLPEMPARAVTVYTDDMAPLAVEAARRVRRFLYCDPILIRANSPGDAYLTKLRLGHILGPVPLMFFDADWWPVREGNLPFAPDGFAAVHDAPGMADERAFPHWDVRQLNLPPRDYCNTGFFLADFRSARVCEAFDRAAGYWAARGQFAIRDFGEQTFLNLALFVSRIRPVLLPDIWNRVHPGAYTAGQARRLPPSATRDLIAIHAAGVEQGQKERWLKIHAGACNPGG